MDLSDSNMDQVGLVNCFSRPDNSILFVNKSEDPIVTLYLFYVEKDSSFVNFKHRAWGN